MLNTPLERVLLSLLAVVVEQLPLSCTPRPPLVTLSNNDSLDGAVPFVLTKDAASSLVHFLGRQLPEQNPFPRPSDLNRILTPLNPKNGLSNSAPQYCPPNRESPPRPSNNPENNDRTISPPSFPPYTTTILLLIMSLALRLRQLPFFRGGRSEIQILHTDPLLQNLTRKRTATVT